MLLKLRNGGDPLSKYLLTHFSPNIRHLIESYDGLSTPLESILKRLLAELNFLLEESSLYDEQRFIHLTLSEEAQSLIDQKPRSENLISLNRVLLEEAYPTEIQKSNPKQVIFEGEPFTALSVLKMRDELLRTNY